MSNKSQPTLIRTIDVDMSSAAIAQRIREAGELNGLGLSLAKAMPCRSPYATPATEVAASPDVSHMSDDDPSAPTPTPH